MGRKARKPEPDWLEQIGLAGFSVEDLLGADPLSDPPGPSAVSRLVGAPFRLAGAIVKLPTTLALAVVRLPFRVLRAVLPPWGRRGSAG